MGALLFADNFGCHDCDINADCQYDADRLTYRCMCNVGYSGDGYRCYHMGKSLYGLK